MNKRSKIKGLIRNQTCDNCDLRESKKGKEYCDSSYFTDDLPEERTCCQWRERKEMKFTIGSIPAGVKPKKLKIKWTKEVELEPEPLSPDVEKEVIKQVEKELA